MMKLTESQLTQYANQFLNKNYGFELTVPLRINGRLTRTYGRFGYRKYSNGRKVPLYVELSRNLVENNEMVAVLDVLCHELVHYALFMQDKPNSDGHPVFESELERLGIVSQDNIAKKYSIKSAMRTYQCTDCNTKFKRGRALPNGGRGYKCSCGGKLKDLGKI